MCSDRSNHISRKVHTQEKSKDKDRFLDLNLSEDATDQAVRVYYKLRSLDEFTRNVMLWLGSVCAETIGWVM